jgi:hypothetical protein
VNDAVLLQVLDTLEQLFDPVLGLCDIVARFVPVLDQKRVQIALLS